jgi:hypothetical protein
MIGCFIIPEKKKYKKHNEIEAKKNLDDILIFIKFQIYGIVISRSRDYQLYLSFTSLFVSIKGFFVGFFI